MIVDGLFDSITPSFDFDSFDIENKKKIFKNIKNMNISYGQHEIVFL